MAAMSASPSQEKEMIRAACSHPQFIAIIYDMIHTLSNYRIINKDTSERGYLPEHTTTLIGGAAFILHAYEQNGRSMQRMQGVPQTSDIDIAIWYNNVIEDAAEFTAKNKLMESNVRTLFSYPDIINTFHRVMRTFGRSAIQTFNIEVPASTTYVNRTTTIKINFIMNGHRVPVVDLAIKNAIYSQPTERNVRTIPVEQNITHTDQTNTTFLTIFNKQVRVPTLERFIEQQQFAIEAVRDRSTLPKYQARLRYLMQRRGPALGSAAALDAIRARTARAIQSMESVLPVARNSGRPPLHPRRGGKRRTYRKK